MTYGEIFKTIGYVEPNENATVSEITESYLAYMVYYLVKHNAMPENFDFSFHAEQRLAVLCKKIILKNP